jgi:ATP-binding cassette subfamily B protein
MVKERNQNKPSYNTSKILARMFSYIWKYKLLLALYVFFSICVTLTSLAFASLINSSVGSAINGKPNELVKCIEQTVIVVLAGITATYFSKYFYGIFKSKVMLDIRNSAVKRLQKLRLSFIENNHTGDMMLRIMRWRKSA